MKVFGLQAPIYRVGALASRLAAKTSDVAEARRDAVARWMQARQHGLTAQQAAHVVGVSRATLYRWQRRLEPRSRKPHTPRPRQWSRTLATAVADGRIRPGHLVLMEALGGGLSWGASLVRW